MTDGADGTFTVARALTHPGEGTCAHNVAFAFSDGRVAAIRDAAAPSSADRLALPALVNAHDHGLGLSNVALGAGDDPLEIWRVGLYGRPALDPYANAAVAFGRQALSGVGTVVHLHVGGARGAAMLDQVRAVCGAARDVGVRLAFVYPLHDRNWLTYGGDDALLAGYPENLRGWLRRNLVREAPPLDEVAATAEQAAAICADAGVVFQLGPNGPQWCSDPLLRLAADLSAANGWRIHMHLLETRTQRAWADRTHPDRLLAHLDSLGLVSERLTVAHGVWLREPEMALLAERGATVAVNAVSNMRLRSGRSPVAAFLRSGLRFALGLDSFSLDDDCDALRDLRVAYLLNAHAMVEPPLDPKLLFEAALSRGYFSATGETGYGVLRAGAPADLVTIDLDGLAADRLEGTVAEQDLFLTRASARHVADLVVAGRPVVRDGRLTGIDLDGLVRELARQARAAPGGDEAQHFMAWHKAGLRAHIAAAS
ncbi:amidohydrolase family protein [Reyranella sp.]|uniref:amidohydrolase family protein n=1 Tax=Reyranella sp. TaxID=1929291 RepID=UPI003BAAE585